MISKADVLVGYEEKCLELNVPGNPALYHLFEEQALSQQEQEERRQELEAEGEEYSEEESNTLDLIFMGNDKYNFKHRLSDTDLVPLTAVLQSYSVFIQHIDMRFNWIGDAGALVLARLLRETVNLKTLNLQSNSLGANGAVAIAHSLHTMSSLVYLNMNGNQIETRGAEAFSKLLVTCSKLVELDFGNNSIDHDGIIALTTLMIKSGHSLEVLNLENPIFNSVMQETVVHFGKLLSVNRTLQKLSLRKFRLRCDGMYTLVQHLMDNSTLKVINLSCNDISAQGAESLAQYLKQDYCSLESVNLSANKLGDLGAKAIAQALAVNRNLIHIDLTSNSIGDDGLARVAESLFHNSNLLSFKLFGNHFHQTSLKLFHRLFQTPRPNEWYPDFNTYIVDDAVQMAYIETEIPYDIFI
jgi:Ran GTPase-activating protein (RanGAP) involved in mRNA processing and transport